MALCRFEYFLEFTIKFLVTTISFRQKLRLNLIFQILIHQPHALLNQLLEQVSIPPQRRRKLQPPLEKSDRVYSLATAEILRESGIFDGFTQTLYFDE